MSGLSALSGISGMPALFGGGFSLTDIAGLTLWLEAGVGTWQDAAMTIPAVNDGDPVGGWADQSGNGNHPTQPTAAKRPKLRLNIVNTLPVIRFDGIDDWLKRIMINVTQPWSLFMVFTVRLWVADRHIIDGANLQSRISESAAVGRLQYNCGAGLSIDGFVVNTFWLITGMVNGAASNIYRNNLAPSAGNLGALNMPNITIAARGTALGSGHSQIDVAEIVIYNALLSDDDRALVWDYLNTKYALW